jgi:DNA-binding MarR family transcriptional regulator
MEDHSSHFSLTLSEWRVINALAANPMVSGEEIARELHMEKMTVSRSLRSLEKAGRVAHRKDPSNLKRNQWTLTQVGWELFDSLAPMALAHQEAFMSALTMREREQLFRLLDKLTG